jgi:hypothetical protein
MANTIFADSPRNGGWGDRPYSIADISGPASYVQVVTGATPSGGQSITAAMFGLGAGMEGVEPIAASTTGTYEVVAIQAPFLTGQNNPNWILRWIVSATGAEAGAATNLSAEQVRLRAFGPY